MQVLPVIRQALLVELTARYPARPPLLRDPSDGAGQLLSRGFAGAKALTVKLLASGFGRAARARHIVTNHRFAGYSAFDTTASYQAEIDSELNRAPETRSGLAIVMCHPGYADAALAALDTVVERRQQEHDGLMQLDALPQRIWHAKRTVDGAPIDWTKTDVRV